MLLPINSFSYVKFFWSALTWVNLKDLSLSFRHSFHTMCLFYIFSRIFILLRRQGHQVPRVL